MMREVFVVSDNIFSPLGHNSADNFEQLRKGISGITQHNKKQINDQPFYASLFKEEDFDKASTFTRFEQALIRSIEDAIKD
ncbi:MAG TPA: beta-ketoacyl synthase, partial [Puia sp.]|nr:beta-ketoacyl synthase [Puia sp.]